MRLTSRLDQARARGLVATIGSPESQRRHFRARRSGTIELGLGRGPRRPRLRNARGAVFKQGLRGHPRNAMHRQFGHDQIDRAQST